MGRENLAKELDCRIIVAISSDIGASLASHWLDLGIKVIGTYRTWSETCSKLKARGVDLYHCDLSCWSSIKECCEAIAERHRWDVLVIAAGLLEPVGMFAQTSFMDWALSFEVNCIAQLGILHALLEYRSLKSTIGPLALFFAGGGTNSATTHFLRIRLRRSALLRQLSCSMLKFWTLALQFLDQDGLTQKSITRPSLLVTEPANP